MDHRIVLTAATMALAVACSRPTMAQAFGPAQVFDIEPQIKCDFYNDPIMLGDIALRTGYPKKMEKGRYQRVMVNMALDGSATHTEKLVDLTAYISNYFTFGGRPCVLTQSRNKETGIVDLSVQACDNSWAPEDVPVKVGSIPLDPRSSNAVALEIETFVSPDGTKLLVYCDGIQSNDIKLAMCWVLDTSFEPIWNGSYRLPVQALGATTTTHFFDDGTVSVSVEAVVLDQDNTKERSDGSMAAKVEKYYANKTTTTLYAMHGKSFARVDADAISRERMLTGQLLHSPAGWTFAAIASSGKGKNEVTEIVFGTLGSEGVSATSSSPIDMHHSAGVVLDDAGAFYVHHADKEDDLVVIKLDPTGQELWRHTAPYGRSPEFQVVNGRLIDYFSASKTSLVSLRSGQAARGDTHTLAQLPLLGIWHDGQRSILSIVSEEASLKETAVGIWKGCITKAGILFAAGKQDAPSLTFLPFVW